MRFGDLATQFQRRNRLLAAHGWKAVEELVQRIPGLEMIVKRFSGTRVPTNTGVPPSISGSL